MKCFCHIFNGSAQMYRHSSPYVPHMQPPFKILSRLAVAVLELKTKFTYCVFMPHIKMLTLKKIIYGNYYIKNTKKSPPPRFHFGIFINFVHKKFTFYIIIRCKLYISYHFICNLHLFLVVFATCVISLSTPIFFTSAYCFSNVPARVFSP